MKLLFAPLFLALASCVSSSGARDILHDELSLLPDDARLFAAIVESENADLADDLRELALFVEEAHESYHMAADEVAGVESALFKVDLALGMAASLSARYGDELPRWVTDYLAIAKLVAERVRLRLEPSGTGAG